MGHKTKNGINSYFVDSSMMNSEQVAAVNYRYPVIGMAVAWAVNDFIFSEKGYYVRWEDDGQEIIEAVAQRIGFDDVKVVRAILIAYIANGFFDLDLFYRYGILSSKEHQVLFRKTATKVHRKIKSIKPQYDLTGRFGDGPKRLTPT